MIEAIDEKYCKNNLVQLMSRSDACQLIMNADEIIFLKIGDKVLINKYLDHPSRYLFPDSDKEKHHSSAFSTTYTHIYEYNKTYLNYNGSIGGFSFHQNYFFKGSNRALFVNWGLDLDNREENCEEILTRSEIEDIFDDFLYDSMYIIDRNGRILYAKSKEDGLVISNKIIPSDEDIIKRDQRERGSAYSLAAMFNPEFDTMENRELANMPKSIDEIKNLVLYGGFLCNYSNFLITSKDGKFDVKWFKIEFIEKDKFKLTTRNVPVSEPTIDDVLEYANNSEISKVLDLDNQEIRDFSQNIKHDNNETDSNSDEDNFKNTLKYAKVVPYVDEVDSKKEKTIGKILKKVFKK